MFLIPILPSLGSDFDLYTHLFSKIFRLGLGDRFAADTTFPDGW